MKKYFVVVGILMLFLTEANALDQAESINYAIKNNPTVIALQKKAAAAKARLNQATSAFFPTANLSGDIDKAYSSPATAQINIGGVAQNVTIGTDANASVSGIQASVSQPVFVSALFPEFNIAQKRFDAANNNYQQTVIDTSFIVTQNYFGVLKALKMKKLMSDSLELSRSHRKQVQSMLNAGMAKKADLLQSMVREANDNVALIQSKYDIDLAKGSFNNALGKDIKQPVELKDEGFTGKLNDLPGFDELLSTAYANRPDWKTCLLETGISEEQLKLSQSDYLPNIVLSANSGNKTTTYPAYKSNINSWNVSGTGSWKIFDSFGRENKVQEASENLSAQRSQVEQFRNNIALEVNDAYLNLKSALELVIATQQAVDSAEESYKVSTSLYNAGMGTNVEVIDAEVALTKSKTDHLNALFNVEVARAKTNKAVGKNVL
ncbi:MAG: TolC family protein [Candidatus Margulisiibacteriota bacterium]